MSIFSWHKRQATTWDEFELLHFSVGGALLAKWKQDRFEMQQVAIGMRDIKLSHGPHCCIAREMEKVALERRESAFDPHTRASQSDAVVLFQKVLKFKKSIP